MTITTKQTISILCVLLIGLSVTFPEGLAVGGNSLQLAALALAALLPAGFYPVSTLQGSLTLPLIMVISALLAALWYFVLTDIYPAGALLFGGVVFCGSYIILRIK